MTTSDSAGRAESERLHKLREVELHEHLAPEYVRRYKPAFSSLFQRYWNDEILASTQPVSGRVLDCGCGTGVMLSTLASHFESVHAVDLSPDMLRLAARRETPGVRLCAIVRADAELLPYEDEYFDSVVCRGSLHHMPNLDAVLCELRRVLRPGGRLVVSEPCNDSWLVRTARRCLYVLSNRFEEADEGYSSDEFNRCIRSAGFRILESRRFGYLAYALAGFPDIVPILKVLPFARGLTSVLIRVDRVIERVPGLAGMGFHIMVTAERDENCEDF